MVYCTLQAIFTSRPGSYPGTDLALYRSELLSIYSQRASFFQHNLKLNGAFLSSVSNHNLPFKKIINCNLNNIRRKKKKEVQKEAGNCIYIFKKMSKIVYNAGRRLRSSHTCLSKSNNLKRPSLLY